MFGRAVEIEIGVLREVDDRRLVAGRREFDPQRRRLQHPIDAGGRQIAGKAGIAIGRMKRQRHRRCVMRAELPDPMAEAVRAAVQRMLLARLARELIRDPVEHEPAIRDAVGVAAGNRAEVGRMGDVIFDRIEAEDNALPASCSWNVKIAEDRSIGQDLRDRACLAADRDFQHWSAIDLAKASYTHMRSPCPARVMCVLRPDHRAPRGSRQKRRETSTSVRTPVFVL